MSGLCKNDESEIIAINASENNILRIVIQNFEDIIIKYWKKWKKGLEARRYWWVFWNMGGYVNTLLEDL